MNDTLLVFASKVEFNAVFPQISAVVATTSTIAVGTSYDVTVCGVGVLDFTVNLSNKLTQKKYNRVILLGICGAYLGRDLQVGDVVRVDSEILGDLGVQNREGHFIPWGEVSGKPTVYAGASTRALPLMLASIRSVAGVTVNCCTGTQYLSLKRAALFNADVESMEGAACFALCQSLGISAYEFRGVSNIATDRDPSQWRIAEAMAALKAQVIDNL